MRYIYLTGLSVCLMLFTYDATASKKTEEIANTYYKSAIELPGSASLEEVFESFARSAELGNPAVSISRYFECHGRYHSRLPTKLQASLHRGVVRPASALKDRPAAGS
jgi:hypothetical protein